MEIERGRGRNEYRAWCSNPERQMSSWMTAKSLEDVKSVSFRLKNVLASALQVRVSGSAILCVILAREETVRRDSLDSEKYEKRGY